MITKHIAKHVREVYNGGNWTTSSLKEHLADLSWEEATRKIYDCNSIAALAYHINYYVVGVTAVLEGGPLIIKDKFSFDHPEINSDEDWQNFQTSLWQDIEKFALLVAQLSEGSLLEDFADAKYGNYFRNLHGIIEHTHYHLGQIVILKKIIRHA